ncbi:hypothetical protein [Maribacter sp. HTCC2170]|uniref:hypothetical protein n=1 Tax=Maribacter sp. (strain HTCC2170 / KCCM 42371) TaxID=313603 RepID=UPI00006BD2A2|nr:hypothetical protein [Maribacter sp. HTCC2170]EAR02348.1 hypothetical protein FB2170_03655 [Maribacter sp. HTCC2170]
MEQIILGTKPSFLIELHNDSFEIHENGNENQIFEYAFVDSLRVSKRINWLVTVLSFITEFLLNSSGNVYKERDVLRFNYQGKPQKYSLKDCDIKLALQTINRINDIIRTVK